MGFQQQLSTGLTVRQDFRSSVRFVMFETGVEGFKYATHGGTLFVVNVRGRPFGITVDHIKGDFEWRNLIVTEKKFGRLFAGLQGIYHPTQPTGHAVDSDVLQLVVVKFSPDVGPSFFEDAPYIFDAGTTGSSARGDQLRVNGTLKAESRIDGEDIIPKFGLLEFTDEGLYRHDLVLRKAVARYDAPEFKALTGLSGSPVFNVTQRRLAGVVVRGTMQVSDATIYYIDVAHLDAVLQAIIDGKSATNYMAFVEP